LPANSKLVFSIFVKKYEYILQYVILFTALEYAYELLGGFAKQNELQYFLQQKFKIDKFLII
jgi:hypothetical protein